MFAVYAKDEDYNIVCSERYQETEFLGVYSTIELAKNQIEYHKKNIQQRCIEKRTITPCKWGYYIYLCEINCSVTMDEKCAVR